MITYKKGDLFSSDAEALAHGCNTLGKMNAGIAIEFKQRFPDMFQDYQQRCRRGLFLPGKGYIYYREQKPHVINLATQSDGLAELCYVDKSLGWLRDSYENLGVKTVAMPRIGCGLGGLEWHQVKDILEKYFDNHDLNLEVWTLKTRNSGIRKR